MSAPTRGARSSRKAALTVRSKGPSWVVVTVALTAAVVVVWRRRRRTPRPQRSERRLLAMATIALVPMLAFFALVTVANASTVARPAPALLGFFEGSA